MTRIADLKIPLYKESHEPLSLADLKKALMVIDISKNDSCYSVFDCPFDGDVLCTACCGFSWNKDKVFKAIKKDSISKLTR